MKGALAVNDIEKYKELLDAGVITQEEFNSQKERIEKENLEIELAKKKRKRTTIIIVGVACAVIGLFLLTQSISSIKCKSYQKNLIGHTYENVHPDYGWESRLSFESPNMCDYKIVDLPGYKEFTVSKDSSGYYIHIDGWSKNFYIEETKGGVPTVLRDEKLDDLYTMSY